ncbi:hypothetical protein [Acidocella sp.]|uniref:hypothetical protein n=1 Tax=Acidocella sp. TaxID=50710 RepID=UPI002F42051B
MTDSEDATNAFPGAMLALTNLIPSQTTRNAWVPRAASAEITGFPGIGGAATGTALLVVGNLAYGFMGATSGTLAGLDVPYVYDLDANVFLPITGITANNLPQTPATTGDWTPPTIAVIGARIVFTHPGFLGSSNGYFGWLDESAFTSTDLVANTDGTNVLKSVTTDPVAAGVAPGMTIAGTNIPAGATVISLTEGTFDLETTGTFTSGSPSVTGVASVAGVLIGMTATGPAIPAGTLVTNVAGSTVTLSNNATANGVLAVDFTGGSTITISANTTGSTNSVALTINGGTAATPQWASGNTNANPLTGVPQAVNQFNSRAYYAVGSALVFSDTDNATQVSDDSFFQAITFPNGLEITALAQLPLSSTALGGMVQALIVFQETNIAQITGDPSTGNFARNNIGVGVGCLAPNTIAATPQGLAFIATDGLRIINFLGVLSDPIGANGDGICNPFLNAVAQTRMAAAYNQSVYRVSVQNAAATGSPVQEWWFHFGPIKAWSGPHTFPARLIAAWKGPDVPEPSRGFVMVPYAAPNELWTSPAVALSDSNYIENGATLSWTYETSLLPDNQVMSENAIIETTLMIKSPYNVTVTAADENGNLLDEIGILAQPGGNLIQQQIAWDQPVVFKQMTVTAEGTSAQDVEVGNLYLRYQILGYLIGTASPGVVVKNYIELENGAGHIALEDGSGAILLENST